jgi:phosphatidylserine/phosphatidylglycerophosphate/cardiolipin synthase-like enzyme
MHAKVAFADADVGPVASANLSGSAIESNMEVRLLVGGGPVPRRLARHLRALVVDGILVEVTS